jgi:tetratricopeptide (TPR) repeat protein
MKNRYDYPERTIVTTWQISFDELERRNEGAAKLLRLWGYLDNQELWFQLLQWEGYESAAPSWLRKITATEISFIETIDILLNYSLIERNDCETYSMHAVVHDWIRASINADKDEGMLDIATTTIGLAVPEGEVRNSWIIKRRILLHALRWLEYWDQVGEASETVSGDAHLAGLHSLGILYKDQGRLSEAEAMYDRALAGREKASGTEHPSMLQTVNSLGVLYSEQGRLAKAEAMYDRALAGCEKAFGPEHPSTLQTVNNLGILYSDQGRLAEAEAMYDRALAGYEKAFDAEYPSTLRTVNNLGTLYKDQGRLAEAEAMYDRALSGSEKAFGAEHPSTLGTVNNLGTLYKDQGRLAEAEDMYTKALAGEENVLGVEHPSTQGTANNLIKLYRNQGRLAEADGIHQRTFKSVALLETHPS